MIKDKFTDAELQLIEQLAKQSGKTIEEVISHIDALNNHVMNSSERLDNEAIELLESGALNKCHSREIAVKTKIVPNPNGNRAARRLAAKKKKR